jgi:DNA-binding CsgD family transcriptional regulator/tetratricopeptide (TPR) repeat protein
LEVAERVTTAAVRASTSTRFGRLTSPVLVGRERELGILLEAAACSPAVVVVEGEAGVGKTRLVEEFLARPELADRGRYVGRCHQLSEPFPLGPVLEALLRAEPRADNLAPVAGALRAVLPELAPILPAAPEPLGDKLAERHRLFRAVRELLGALGPSVLVLEDLHWGDQATLELLLFLLPELPPAILLVCTYRSEDVPEGSPLLRLTARTPSASSSARLELELLDRAQVRDLVGEILESDNISDEFAGYLFERSAGLPFVVEEMLLLLKEREGLVHRSGVWVRRELEELRVPRAYRDSTLERMASLSAAARSLVQAAAVLGAPTAEEVIHGVAGLADIGAPEALTDALSSALLFEVGEGTYGFRHPLARQGVEDAIATPLRRQLHLRAARALEAERPRPLGRLAHHYREAGDMKKWIHYAEAAADRASSLEDNATAYVFLKEAVSVERLPAATRRRLAVKLATHALQGLAHTDAIAVLGKLLDDETLPRGLRGELRVWLGRLLHQAGETERGFSEVERALEDLGRRQAVAAQAMAILARPWSVEGRIDQHLHWLERAMAAAARSEDRVRQTAVVVDRAVALLTVGDRRCWEAVEQIPPTGETPEDMKRAVVACSNLSSAALKVGHYQRGKEFIETGLRLATETEYARGKKFLRMNELELDWLVGAWDGLEQRAERSLEERWDSPQARAHAQTVLGLVALARGNVRTALRLLMPLADDFHGMVPALTWLTGGLARIRLAEGKTEAAVAEAAKGMDPIRRKDAWVWAADVVPVMVEALLASERRPDALELTRRFHEGLEGRDAPAASAGLIVSQALLAEASGENEQAAHRFLAAAQTWQGLPRPYDAARAREGAGRSLLATDIARGRELLVEAMDAFRTLGATWDVARIRRTLRSHGLVAPHRRGRKGYGGALSPREAEVAGLARDGLSNREIALKLFLSPKTVDHHLSSAMRKLGVASRTELPRQLDAAQPPLAGRL